jgi:hypothetical protein
MHVIDSKKEMVKGIEPVLDGLADGRLILGTLGFSEYVALLRLVS